MQTSGPSLQRLHFPGFCEICSSLVAFWQPKLAENSVKAVRSTIVNDIGEARCHTEKWDLSSSSRRDSFTYNHRPIRASATARTRSSLLPLKRSHTFPLLTRAPEAFGKTPQPRRNAICSPSVVAWKSVQKSKSAKVIDSINSACCPHHGLATAQHRAIRRLPSRVRATDKRAARILQSREGHPRRLQFLEHDRRP